MDNKHPEVKKWMQEGPTPEHLQALQNVRNNLGKMRKEMQGIEAQMEALHQAIDNSVERDRKPEFTEELSRLEAIHAEMRESYEEQEQMVTDAGVDPQQPTLH
jgi:hypothetical protein